MMFVCDGDKMMVRKEPSFGMIGLRMVNIDTDVYFISGNQCEKHCLLTNQVNVLENLNFNHIKAGCCRVDSSLVVVSGVKCQAIEVYDTRNF